MIGQARQSFFQSYLLLYTIPHNIFFLLHPSVFFNRFRFVSIYKSGPICSILFPEQSWVSDISLHSLTETFWIFKAVVASNPPKKNPVIFFYFNQVMHRFPFQVEWGSSLINFPSWFHLEGSLKGIKWKFPSEKIGFSILHTCIYYVLNFFSNLNL